LIHRHHWEHNATHFWIPTNSADQHIQQAKHKTAHFLGDPWIGYAMQCNAVRCGAVRFPP
jgi:hypothetical protein